MSEVPFYQSLLDDHNETLRVLETIVALVTAPQKDWQALEAAIEGLCRALSVHYHVEELGLFSVLNPYKTMILMEKEHEMLLENHAQLLLALAAKDDNALMASFLTLKEQLEAHILEENNGVFPMAASKLAPEEQALSKRKMAELDAYFKQHPEAIPSFDRPLPQVTVTPYKVLCAQETPIAFTPCFKQDHVTLSAMYLQAGQSLKPHWAGETQCLIVLSGTGELHAMEKIERLLPGTQVDLAPRTMFSLQAITDIEVLALKVWPKPHFTK